MKIENHGRLDLNRTCHNTAKILLTGDLCPLGEVEENLLNGNVNDVFGEVLSEIQDKDLSIANLELALTTSGTAIDKCGPNLRANPQIMPELNSAGFDVYSVANNHSRDWGNEAFIETLSYIKKSGGKYVGGGENAASAAKPLTLEVLPGLKLAIFALSMHSDSDAGAGTPGVNALNLPYNSLEILKSKDAGYQVIVIIHDGKERVPFPSERIRNYSRAFIDAGASAVIGHHPHIIRGIELYKGGVIAYSLGNFLFPSPEKKDDPDSFWFKGFAIRLKLDSEGLCGFDIIPHTYNQQEGRMEIMKGSKRSQFFSVLNRLNEILATGNENERYFSADCDQITYYGKDLKLFGKNLLNQSWQTPETKENAKRFYHYLKCNEHWDLLETLSFRKWHGITDIPEDLKSIISCLGR